VWLLQPALNCFTVDVLCIHALAYSLKKNILNTFVLPTQVGDDKMDATSSCAQPQRGVPNRKFESLAKALTGLGAGKRVVLPGE
jgi:hypothetical protein